MKAFAELYPCKRFHSVNYWKQRTSSILHKLLRKLYLWSIGYQSESVFAAAASIFTFHHFIISVILLLCYNPFYSWSHFIIILLFILCILLSVILFKRLVHWWDVILEVFLEWIIFLIVFIFFNYYNLTS